MKQENVKILFFPFEITCSYVIVYICVSGILNYRENYLQKSVQDVWDEESS